MSNENPYSAPEASLENSSIDKLGVTPRKLPAGNSVQWIGAAWKLFKEHPFLWMGMTFLMMIIVMILSLIPIVSLVMYILMPMFTGGLMLGAHTQREGGDLKFGHLFAGFSTRAGSLAGVGGFFLLGMILLIVVFVIIGVVMGVGAGMFSSVGGMDAGMGDGVFGIGMVLMMLVALAVVIPLYMAYWFAPALVVIAEMRALDAMKLSFRACMKNILPILLYILLVFLLLILGSIPAFLGLLVVIPLLTIVTYTAYRDIFTEDL